MYSYSDRLKAIEAYIQYGKSAAATVRALGYPSKKQLRRWYQGYLASGQIPLRKKRKQKYTVAERRRAVEHYFRTYPRSSTITTSNLSSRVSASVSFSSALARCSVWTSSMAGMNFTRIPAPISP